ncbi:MAG: c-type cytochrome, partial [Pseudomonadota bacterium]
MDVTNFLKSFDNVMGGKWVASAVGALLVFMLLGFMSGQIYGTRGGHHGPEELAFALEIEEAVVEEEEDEAVDYQALLASVDLGEGEKFFKKCASCHKVADGENGVGPHLYGVVGRDIGSVGDYAYSSTLSGLDGNWTLTALDGFLANPKGWAPGTSMGYAGAKNPEDRINVIAWLNEQGGAPIDLTEGLEVAAASDAEVMTDAEAEVAEPVEEVSEAAKEVAEEVTEEVTETAEAAVEEVTEEVTETADEVTEEVTETPEAVTEEVTEEVTETAEAATEEVTETAEAATEEVTETAE